MLEKSPNRTSTTGIKNIHAYFDPVKGATRYAVKIWIDGKCYSFGTFFDVGSATRVLDQITAYDLNNPTIRRQAQIWGQEQGRIARQRIIPQKQTNAASELKPERRAQTEFELKDGDKEDAGFLDRSFFECLRLIEEKGTKWQLRKCLRAVDAIIKTVKKINARNRKYLSKIK